MSKARYEGTVRDFFEQSRPGALPTLLAKLKQKAALEGAAPALTGEEGSWINSLPTIAELLMEAGLAKAGVLLEYNPYQAGNGRADVVVTGTKNSQSVVLVVELKQWSQATWNAEAQKVTDFQAKYSTSRHPYRQAADYAAFIANYTEGFEADLARVEACAFLHNANEEAIQTLRTAGADEASNTFSGDATGRLRFKTFLQETMDPSNGLDVARDLLRAKFLQSANILKVAAKTFQDPEAFPLTDEQNSVVDRILDIVREVQDPTAAKNSAIVVVKGAPGSGKTWICLHLMGRLAAAQSQVAFATNSTALRQTLTRIARQTAATRAIAGMVTSARSYWNTDRWSSPLDLLVVDEAQRISEFTVRTGHANRRHVQEHLESKGITQLFELKKSASIVVLMIDEGQATTASDHLTSVQARDLATLVGSDFVELELTEQHRSGGSKRYEEWVDSLVAGTPQTWSGDDNFTVELVETPEEMEESLLSKDSESKRILAGFTWAWQKPTSPDVADLPREVAIGEWSMPWNLQQPVADLPGKDLWALTPSGQGQVGSVFTAQGFEFDYCAVIIGPDLRLDATGEKLEPDVSASKYRKLVTAASKNASKVDYIRNQYRVLLTRAMRGVIIYAVDPDVRELLRELITKEAESDG
ncbi:DNA/RNA helicase domain-containing protein [Ornithinimicrobium cerasi]|uniref:DNA/RNA helicase domain-containing protein n=1 Tax=Ornithinimicrobium cerasi TaxID=2248773 RepID=UPI000EFE0618|nr:DNA/RNA helicase domain-containing protein [Ornithinimicrobium cerasi]